jgi:hypothetical protein
VLRDDNTLICTWNVFEWNHDSSVVGFGRIRKHIFKCIATTLRSYHLASTYCGDAWNRIVIDTNFNILFPFIPIKAKDDNDLQIGIMNDILCFRKMVYTTTLDYIPNLN